MIKSFKCKDTEALTQGRRIRRFQAFAAIALRKLVMIEEAKELRDLASPPGNRLKKLEGGEIWSIRINDQWRICFTWRDGGAEDIEIVDYH